MTLIMSPGAAAVAGIACNAMLIILSTGLLTGPGSFSVWATRLFQFIWGRFDDQEPPDPEHRDVSWPKLAAALALQGAIFRLVRGIVDHGARTAFFRRDQARCS